MNSIKLQTLFLTFLICISIRASSNSTQYDFSTQRPTSSDADVSNILRRDIETLAHAIEDIPKASLYTKRRETEQKLRDELASDSPLRLFPNIDEQTYVNFVNALTQKFKTDPDYVGVLLNVWSYIVGIPIIGLKHSCSYYKRNNHLFPHASKDTCKNLTVSITNDEICFKLPGASEKLDDTNHKHWAVSDTLYFSSINFRKNFLGMSSSKLEKENQQIVWDFLKHQVVSFADLDQDLCKILFKCLVRINHQGNKKPYFSLGLITLFRNTAIYVSLRRITGSKVINSQCSMEKDAYYGFQDGVFIENGETKDSIFALFGAQFFRRALFRKYYCESPFCSSKLKCLYSPHYSYDSLSKDEKYIINDLTKSRQLKGEELSFAQDFCNYFKGAEIESLASKSLIKSLITSIDKQQLKVPLCEKTALEKILFEPSDSVDLSSKLVDLSQSSTSSSPHQLILLVIDHLKCIDYQTLVSLNVSNNNLGDQEVKMLAATLKQNVVPELAKLNLSNNRISKQGLVSLRNLLEREKFKSLLLVANSFRDLPEDFSDALKKKITWKV